LRKSVKAVGVPVCRRDRAPFRGNQWLSHKLGLRRRDDGKHSIRTGDGHQPCSGAGLVTVASPDAVLPIIAASQAEVMTEPLVSTKWGTIAAANGNANRLHALTQGRTLLAIGPGIGTHAETQKFITSLVRQTELPVILDADGLNAFAGRGQDLVKRKTKHLALTPHPGEMARLLGLSSATVQADRLAIA